MWTGLEGPGRATSGWQATVLTNYYAYSGVEPCLTSEVSSKVVMVICGVKSSII